MRPVSRRDLVVVAVGLGVVGWLVVGTFYGDLAALRWWQPLPLALLAVAEALGARSLRSRLGADRARRRAARSGEAAALAPGDRPADPVEPMLVARLAVLAQASAWVGAAFLGLWAGALVFTASQVGRLAAASGDAVAAGTGVVCSLVLVAAALFLEGVCRVPGPPGDDDRRG